VHRIGRRRVFAGQRADAFHVDLGSVFDLGTLRPFQNLHIISTPAGTGVNSLQSYNVHSIVLQVPISEVTRHGNTPTDPAKPGSVIGVWATASRRASRVFDKAKGKYVGHGPFKQVSRLGNPLFNEVIVPMGLKDQWNVQLPKGDKKYAPYVNHPELAKLLPILYPGVFPSLAAYTKKRADLNAILLTGIPLGVVPGPPFQNYTGPVEADMLRLNVAIPPTTSSPDPLGVVAGDLAGWPNGRRVDDDVVTVALRAVAGATIPLVDATYTPDGAASVVTDGTTDTNASTTDIFPYLGLPGGGYQTEPGTTQAS
jgi:hypothetical protein